MLFLLDCRVEVQNRRGYQGLHGACKHARADCHRCVDWIQLAFVRVLHIDVDRRKNLYDGVEEYWVKIRETGKRRHEQSYEMTQTNAAKAMCYVYFFEKPSHMG